MAEVLKFALQGVSMYILLISTQYLATKDRKEALVKEVLAEVDDRLDKVCDRLGQLETNPVALQPTESVEYLANAQGNLERVYYRRSGIREQPMKVGANQRSFNMNLGN